MNTILQKRIEDAAKEIGKKFYFVGMNPNEAAYKASIQMGNKILQNQWISVEEALPEKRQDVLVAVLDTKSNTYFRGFDNIDDDNGEFLRDKNGFAIENDSHKITHWMPIPSLEGDEK